MPVKKQTSTGRPMASNKPDINIGEAGAFGRKTASCDICCNISNARLMPVCCCTVTSSENSLSKDCHRCAN